MQLKNKVVFLTGGTSGIGRACAKAILQRGAKVIITGRNAEAGLKQTEEFQEEFGQDKVHFIKFDVSEEKEFEGTELARARMRKDKDGGRGGVIINMASLVGYTPFFLMPVYTASKYAVIGYTRSLANVPDIDAQGIRYACVCPHVVDTPMMHSVMLKMRGEYRSYIPSLMPKEWWWHLVKLARP